MTSEQAMLTKPATRSPARPAARLALALPLILGACARHQPGLVAPETLASPYLAARGEVLWAVAPLRNESGSSLPDIAAITDKVVAAAAQVRGVRALPLNRTIAAMRALNMQGIATPDEARQLAAEMGADGIIIGTVTAYDPYDPPALGLSLALYMRPESGRSAADLDSRALTSSPTEPPRPHSNFTGSPSAVTSEHLDAKNHQVQMDIQRYATGRLDGNSALGWRRYVVSMDLFSEFAAWHAVGRLLDQEWVRLGRVDEAK
ncbi:MAG: hypothetical protein IT437_05450 [Phycisphaerales bacterium]|nr:hypothetical protein [Phycisphaerales bacterium]